MTVHFSVRFDPKKAKTRTHWLWFKPNYINIYKKTHDKWIPRNLQIERLFFKKNRNQNWNQKQIRNNFLFTKNPVNRFLSFLFYSWISIFLPCSLHMICSSIFILNLFPVFFSKNCSFSWLISISFRIRRFFPHKNQINFHFNTFLFW